MAARTSALAVVLSAILTAAAGAQQSSTTPVLIFDGVTVVDVEQGKLMPGQRVVIAGSHIQTVADAGAVATPQGAQVIDAKGKYLIPGFWDLHVHTTSDLPFPLLIANGVTGFRDGWSYVPLDTMILWQRAILAGTRIGPPRQLLTGEKAINDMTEDEVAALKARGANFLKVYPLDFAAAAAARHVGLPFGGHVDGIPAIEASDSGISILDHVNSAGDLDRLCLGEEASVEQCGPVADRFRRNNTWWVPTLTRRLHFNRGASPNPGAEVDALVTRFGEVTDKFWAGTAPQGNWLHDASSSGAANTPRFLSVAKRTGLPILAGTDTDVGPDAMRRMPPGLAIHLELAVYVTEGLTPLEALQTATLNPAKMLRATDSLGTVAAGKLADLILLDADPLADITNTTTIRAVVANGRYYDRPTLDRLVADVQAKAKAGFQYWWSDGARKGDLETAP